MSVSGPPALKGSEVSARVDAEGRLVLPRELATSLGLRPGTTVRLEQESHSYRLRRPVEHLAKVYVEPSTLCNLSCRTCLRNAWEGGLGLMAEATFSRVLEGLARFDPVPGVLFGGFGEPLTHPRIGEMVRQVKALGAPRVELVTNGCLLDEAMSRRLLEAGLDVLWVSLDGIRPDSYEDVRLGALLPQVFENLRMFREVRRRLCDLSSLPGPLELPGSGLSRVVLPEYVALEGYLTELLGRLREEGLPSEGEPRRADLAPRLGEDGKSGEERGSGAERAPGEETSAGGEETWTGGTGGEVRRTGEQQPAPELGITFVAMRRNIADLPFVLWLGRLLGASRFNVSNLVPYTAEMEKEILYQRCLSLSPLPTLWSESLRIPPLDITPETERALRSVLHGYHESALTGGDVSGVTGCCPFVDGGTVSISWRGEVSPCQALLHTHEEYVLGRRRLVERHVYGSLAERGLSDIWLDPEYLGFRRRVQEFDFAPCIACGICRSAEGNQEDCEDDTPPRCGACLWAQGLIRCP